jgi:hypothetical protein
MVTKINQWDIRFWVLHAIQGLRFEGKYFERFVRFGPITVLRPSKTEIKRGQRLFS